MSASLVGSEMCIRDRLAPQALRHPCPGDPARPDAGPRGLRRPRRRSHATLQGALRAPRAGAAAR
eukprot:2657019-Alexandrium_andersonii.AAC.1